MSIKCWWNIAGRYKSKDRIFKQKTLKHFVFKHETVDGLETIGLERNPSDNNYLGFTKREARALHRWLGEILEGE